MYVTVYVVKRSCLLLW